jgi:hypothetical protein
MGEKRGATGNTLGNLMGTCWEQRKKEKKEMKSRHFECMLSLCIRCMKFLFPKLFITIFGLG